MLQLRVKSCRAKISDTSLTSFFVHARLFHGKKRRRTHIDSLSCENTITTFVISAADKLSARYNAWQANIWRNRGGTSPFNIKIQVNFPKSNRSFFINCRIFSTAMHRNTITCHITVPIIITYGLFCLIARIWFWIYFTQKSPSTAKSYHNRRIFGR